MAKTNLKGFQITGQSKHAIIVFLLWAFAPLAWFLMWRDQKYHSWFPKLLWVNGIIFGVIFLTQSIIVIPKLNEIYTLLQIQVPSYVHPTAIVLVILFALAQIYAGYHLEKRVRKHHKLVERYLIPIIIIFAIDGVLALSTGILTRLTPAALVRPAIVRVYKDDKHTPQPTPTTPPTIDVSKYELPTPIPTTKPLTFAEMNKLYGPCTKLPTIMYHHIESLDTAKKLGRLGLAVSPEKFKVHMEYLVTHGYHAATMKELLTFFETGAPLPQKSVLITFDDGYEDFYTNAYPILKSLNLQSTVFTPTGLIQNPGYLTWEQIAEMNASGLVLFANHTWSHHSMKSTNAQVEMEIETASRELAEKNLDNPKVFAYPYGTVGDYSEKVLTKYGYNAAFTTRSGSVLCKKQALTLPRVRVGNEGLSSYGL